MHEYECTDNEKSIETESMIKDSIVKKNGFELLKPDDRTEAGLKWIVRILFCFTVCLDL